MAVHTVWLHLAGRIRSVLWQARRSKRSATTVTDDLEFRPANRADLPEIVRMLADDRLGRERERYEDPLPDAYYEAFDRLEAATGNELIVAIRNDRIAGSMQLTWIPSISFQGGMRLLIESVRVDSPLRGRGIGVEMFRWAIGEARRRGCFMVQLTTNNQRPEAQRFYERLGFAASHVGMKLYLR
jgi:GNAT superfamily N-acetyltransferase